MRKSLRCKVYLTHSQKPYARHAFYFLALKNRPSQTITLHFNITRYYTFRVAEQKCHAHVETNWYSKTGSPSGWVRIQTWDADFACEIAYTTSGNARLTWLAYAPPCGLDTFWTSGQHVLVTLLRASLQFFLRFFPETDTIDVQDYLHIDVGVGYEQGSTNMYLSPLVALLEGSPSWFTKWFPIHPKSKQDVEDARLALENFMSSPVNPMAIFRESYAVWDSIAGIMDDLVKRCSQHSSWSSFLAEGLKGSGGGLRAMFPWLPCFARGQRDASLVGTRLSLCARTIFQEQPAYTDDTDGSPTPLLDASLGSDGLRDTKATWDRVLVCNEMLYTMCFSMADIEDEDAQK